MKTQFIETGNQVSTVPFGVKVPTGAVDSNGVVDLTNVNTNDQIVEEYTLQASDNGRVVTFTEADPVTVIVPAGLGAGFNCLCIQTGAGTVTFEDDGTSTLYSPGGLLEIADQYGAVSVIALTDEIFVLNGSLA